MVNELAIIEFLENSVSWFVYAVCIFFMLRFASSCFKKEEGE